jgi:ATP-dependent helicase HrpB
MVGGAGVELAPRSAVRDTELFLALSLRATDRRRDGQRLVELACAVEAEWLAAQFPDDLHTRLETRYDPVERAVIGALTRTFRDLPLGDPQRVPPEPDAAARLLVAALASDREAIVAERRELQDWIARVATVAEWAPGSGVEPIDPPRFAAALAPACVGETRLAAVLRKDLLPLLSSALAYPQQRIVEEWAPSHWTAPSGRRIALRYAAGRAPVLSVRLQELFGCHETPCVARGRIPMLIELLGPNHRPVQTTADLHSFWTNTYAQVRKDLRGRYPKHHWPEDPWTAEARRRR